jgi:hypothetical protein
MRFLTIPWRDDLTIARVITNSEQGTSVTMEINNGPKLCRRDVEWIVEDFYQSGEQVELAHFTDLWFVDSVATTASGKLVGFDGATMVHLQNETGQVLCSAERYDNTNVVLVSHL